MKRKNLIIIGTIGGIVLLALILTSIYATRDGRLVTPQGSGSVTLDVGSFEAFPLPDYIAAALGDGYKSYFIEVAPGLKVHVLEVGRGFPVFLQHGNPTSGALYRKVARNLPLDRVRLIMPTLVGLGFSSKIPAGAHLLDDHIGWINTVLRTLRIEKLVFVGQDWGGPIGMGALAASPDLLAGVVALNTSFNAPQEKMDLSRIHALVKTPIVGEMLTEVLNSIFDGLPRGQGDPASMPPEVIALYKRPVHEAGNFKAPLAMMRMVPDGPDHPSAAAMRRVEAYVKTLDVPAEIVWGMNDPILSRALPIMQGNFPKARITKTEGGHFLQEEVPEEIAAAIWRVVAQVQAQN